MTKFKIGDVITSKEKRKGFEEATVIGMTEDMYLLKILCGKATVLKHIVDTGYDYFPT